MEFVSLEYIEDDGGRSAAGFKGRTGDCLTRAISIATGESYRKVYDAVGEQMKKHGYARSGNAYAQSGKAAAAVRAKGRSRRPRTIQDDVLRLFGFAKVDAKKPNGTCYTYEQAHRRYGTCIVTTTKHYATLKNGALRDTFDGRTYDFQEADLTGYVTMERKARSIWVAA